MQALTVSKTDGAAAAGRRKLGASRPRRADDEHRALAKEVSDAFKRFSEAWKDSLTRARELGEVLIKAKRAVGHGGFQAWRKANCKLSAESASTFMRIARRWREIEAAIRESKTDLTLTQARALLAKPRGAAKDDRPTPPKIAVLEIDDSMDALAAAEEKETDSDGNEGVWESDAPDDRGAAHDALPKRSPDRIASPVAEADGSAARTAGTTPNERFLDLMAISRKFRNVVGEFRDLAGRYEPGKKEAKDAAFQLEMICESLQLIAAYLRRRPKKTTTGS